MIDSVEALRSWLDAECATHQRVPGQPYRCSCDWDGLGWGWVTRDGETLMERDSGQAGWTPVAESTISDPLSWEWHFNTAVLGALGDVLPSGAEGDDGPISWRTESEGLYAAIDWRDRVRDRVLIDQQNFDRLFPSGG